MENLGRFLDGFLGLVSGVSRGRMETVANVSERWQTLGVWPGLGVWAAVLPAFGYVCQSVALANVSECWQTLGVWPGLGAWAVVVPVFGYVCQSSATIRQVAPANVGGSMSFGLFGPGGLGSFIPPFTNPKAPPRGPVDVRWGQLSRGIPGPNGFGRRRRA